MSVEIRRGTGRFVTRGAGHLTRHSFSFGQHYDPDNVRFGSLVCHDDHLLGPGVGFEDHPHADLEIVTWVLTGELRHTDSSGHTGVVRPGEVQVLSAGSGVTHSEIAGPSGPTRFVQSWLTPTTLGTTPSYDVSPVELVPGVLSEVVRIGTATFRVARLEAGDTVVLPDEPLQHVFVAGGALRRSSMAQPLDDGDAFRVTDQPGLAVTAAARTELLVWTFSL
ncbi:pirin family protein [Nocardioides sp. URHA0020]|uniref:pirin family protein n=1 Tax=Nocardioides sp. URHA0020 TaxID=1380392 RepID=UPI000685BBE8|nr:pirin family protein [Nocardioides sp. URHA0020]